MKTFECHHCGSLVFFENVQCVKCGHALGFVPDFCDFGAFDPVDNGQWRSLVPAVKGRLYRICANKPQHQACNWMVPIEDSNPFCISCRLNQTIPDLAVSGNLERWRKLEGAKRRVIYTLLRLGLPLGGVPQQNIPGLQFSFLSDSTGQLTAPTSHCGGLITVNVAEADDEERERRRIRLREVYRTLLGHLRHEVAHYYWDRLVANKGWHGRFRYLFGDESTDYFDALHRYYWQGPPADWPTRCVSAYASAHPWEDWAETWAHYLHMVDTLETADDFNISLRAKHAGDTVVMVSSENRDRTGDDFQKLLDKWFPLTCALNMVNRSMGLPDLYPFVLSTRAVDKLRLIHDVIQSSQRSSV